MKETSLMRLSIVGAEFYAYHGVKPEEQSIGGKYEIDLDLYYRAEEAIIKDDVKSALNYEEAIFCIEEVIYSDPPYRLVETIARDILNMAFEKFHLLEKASVRVRKMNVPIRRVVNYIEAEQTLTREHKED